MQLHIKSLEPNAFVKHSRSKICIDGKTNIIGDDILIESNIINRQDLHETMIKAYKDNYYFCLLTISGIMVDGVSVGDMNGEVGAIEGFSEDSTNEKSGYPSEKFIGGQDFQDADLVVIRSKPVSEPKGEHTVFECFGIYGNNIVTATVKKAFITQGLNKKTVWSYRKPYILNGDYQTKINNFWAVEAQSQN